ncbi:hypothetical protein DACRYDRAFT_17034 [Dacryopinax primogenitus]|uniref:Uncharacterized protein n=1 Tax=Dacryopinax primogenitus (strain DJM 731) TaxID=1858805 RepID=M5FRU0_DACPD|nr:uncharacterized protein DACRYDRAFT_17034 [Dacryopinax primogenitus]EJT99945.1 hypothetical protein DACRYDRAFT_17034 [Dacryopinax primogenitus]
MADYHHITPSPPSPPPKYTPNRMPLIATVSLMVISMVTIATSNALVNLFPVESPPTTPTSPEPDHSSSSSAETRAHRQDAPPESQEPEEEYYGLWTASELSPLSQPRSPYNSPPVVRLQTEEGLPSYGQAVATPPRLGRKGMRVILQGDAPPEYEDAVRACPSRR